MADDDAKPHRGGLLEVGVTSRPLGHSLLNQGKAFTEPVPPSALLSKLNEFLPKLEQANKALELDIMENPEKAAEYDVNNCDDEIDHVEMNVALVPLEDEAEPEATPLKKVTVLE